ncbi:NDR1/HIN1-like protein 1 [Brachypodium distachyon]|uniref:Uncharacterized protein n=1 Tax=Brachypodium distachyon TaxID=15368 RepID=I1IS55_BRADI|nr:NDR1/HIN1-like protein 1 [Brachypodium distachyon]KQJ91170.1 hypothetical protein BRADI_4g36070v3 [Brachypodium distachyon]|eukprot:XP_003576767.1 NDR1/HIN1-like protein 1 [Brachypodium distachyon]
METTSRKHLCEVHRASSVRRERVVLAAAAALAVAAGVVALALFLAYRPTKPQATVARVAVYRLDSNANSSPSSCAVSANLQFMLLLRNPSGRAALLYDGLVAYSSYRGEPVTLPSRLPPLIQEHGGGLAGEAVALTPLLGSGPMPMPVTADAARALDADRAAGRVPLRLVVAGRVRYKTGPFVTGRDLYVRCDVVVGLTAGFAVGGGGGGEVPLLEYPRCAVDG